eukprot:symbB.v1.2.021760.t1/scaffold1897.1/size96769/12
MAAESSGEGLSVPDVNAMLATLDQANLPPEQLQLLRQRLEGQKAEKEGIMRKSMQDFSMFALYLPGCLWQRVQSSEENLSVLDAITQYLGTSLGTRCPSETTQATLASLLVARQSPEHRPQLMAASSLRAFYLTVKSRVGSAMTKMKKDAMPKDCPYIQMLPSNPADLPEAYKALGLEFSVAAAASQQNALQLQMVAPKAKAGLPALLDRAYSTNNLQLALPASGVVAQDQLALPAPAQPVAAQPGPPQPGPAQPAPAQNLLALEAGVADAKEAPAQVGAVTTAPVEPGATKEHVQEKKHVPLSESLRKLGNAAAKGKRTAEAGSSQPAKKKPAGKSSQQSHSSGPIQMKRPAGKADSKAGSKLKSPSKPAKQKLAKQETLGKRALKAQEKAKILKTVPAKLRSQYAKGCSSCRYVKLCTVSCWQKRGFYG